MRISDWSSDVCSSDLKAGLIEPTERTASGYRVYEACDVHTLRFIRRARDLGFLVKQIQELLALWRARGRARTDEGAVASAPRSAERRVGKECVRTGRSRWSPDH